MTYLFVLPDWHSTFPNKDAGLIFLSSMANSIAESILNDGGTVEEVMSPGFGAHSSWKILSLGHCILLTRAGESHIKISWAGSVITEMDIISRIDNLRVSNILGYFCVEAEVALCIGKPMITRSDWGCIFDPHSLLLATPRLLAAAILTIISRKCDSDAILPITMVSHERAPMTKTIVFIGIQLTLLLPLYPCP